MQTQAFIDELARRLRDVEKRQWTETILVKALNSAFSALAQVVPDSCVTHRTIELVEGSEQRIPSDTQKLIRLLHNVCPETGVAKRAVREADMGVMDAVVPQWRQDASRGHIRHWMSDEIERDTFHVWPPAGTVATGPEGAASTGPAAHQYLAVDHDNSGTQTILLQAIDAADVGTEYGAGNTDSFTVALPSDYTPDGATFVLGHRAVAEGATNFNVASAVREGGSTVDRDDPRLVPDAVLSIEFDNGPENFELLSVTAPVAVPATPAPTAPIEVRGTFMQIPVVSLESPELGDPPVVPEEPVDPGPVVIGNAVDLTDLADSEGNGALFNISENGKRFSNTSQYFAIVPANAEMTSGRYYWETRFVTSVSAYDVSAGISMESPLQSTYPGESAGSVGVFENGEVWENFNNTLDVAVIPDGTVVGHLLDFDQNRYSLRVGNSAFVAVKDGGIAGNTWAPILSARSAGVIDGYFYESDLTQSIPSNVQILGIPSVTQQTVDDYNALVIAYNTAVSALADYNDLLNSFELSGALPVDISYVNPLMEWCLYYCYGVDDEGTPNTARANRHYLAFFQMLNKEEDTKVLIDEARVGDEP